MRVKMTDNNNKNISPDKQDQILFMMLVQQHQQIALMGMGELENPSTGRRGKDLKSVKYAIDTIAMLEKLTSGNLTREMSEYLTNILRSLREKFAESNS